MLLEHYCIFVHDAIVKLQTKKTGKLGCTQLALLVSILSTLSVFTFLYAYFERINVGKKDLQQNGIAF